MHLALHSRGVTVEHRKTFKLDALRSLVPRNNARGIGTMSESDWRSPNAYAKMQDADAADFAWEFFRRNSYNREDHGKLHSGTSFFAASKKFRHRWGLLFVPDP